MDVSDIKACKRQENVANLAYFPQNLIAFRPAELYP